MMIRQVWLVLTFCVFLIGIIESKKYKVKVISAKECDAPQEKMDLTVATYTTGVKIIDKHTSVIVSNFTILRAAGPISMTLIINQLTGSKRMETLKLEKVGCHNPITYQLFRTINLELTHDCKVIPGNYLTENINPQDFSWILSKAMVHPGRYEYVVMFYSEKGLAVCNSIICNIQELRSQ